MSIHVLIMFAPKRFFRSLGSTLGFISTGLFAGYYLGTTSTLQNSQKQPQAETALQSSSLSENAPSPPASLPPTSNPSIQTMKKVIFSKKEKSSPFLPSVFSPESHTYGRFLNAAEEADSTLEKKEPFSSWETEQNQKILEKAKSDPEYAKLLVDGILSDPHLSNLEKKKMLAELERRGISPLSAKIEPNPEASPTPTPPVSGDKQNPEKHTLAMWYGSCDKVSETQFELLKKASGALTAASAADQKTVLQKTEFTLPKKMGFLLKFYDDSMKLLNSTFVPRREDDPDLCGEYQINYKQYVTPKIAQGLEAGWMTFAEQISFNNQATASGETMARLPKTVKNIQISEDIQSLSGSSLNTQHSPQ